MFTLMQHMTVSDSTDIVHRDLKLENVLLKSPAESTGTLNIKVHVHGYWTAFYVV